MAHTEFDAALLQYKQALQNFEWAQYEWIPAAVYELLSAEQTLDNIVKEHRRPT